MWWSNGTWPVSLTSNPTSLEAVVVTGTVGAAQKRELGNAIGTINASDVVAEAPVLNMQGLINGRSPSIVVMPTSGQVGTGFGRRDHIVSRNRVVCRRQADVSNLTSQLLERADAARDQVSRFTGQVV